MKRLVYFGLLFFAVVLLSNCVKRELELPEGQTVRINFDWRWLADRQNMPTGLILRFYGPEGNFLFAHTSFPEHFLAHLPEGKYKILVYSPDTAGVSYENMEYFEKAQVTTPSQPKDEEWTESPSNIYGTAIGNLTVLSGESTDTTVTMHPYLHPVTVQLKITGNSSVEVAECFAIIDGVAEAVNLSTGFPVLGSNSSVTGYLYPYRKGYKGTFRLAGCDDRYPSVISFKLRFSDGTERMIRHDFAEVMDKIDQGQSDIPISIELTVDVQSIDGVLVATLKDWIYKQGEIILD